MMEAKKDRVGEVVQNKQGLYMKIVSYRNNKDIEVEFPATHERKKTTYYKFRRGQVAANLKDFHLNEKCSYGHNKYLIIGIGALLVAAAVALTFFLI